MKRVAVIGLIIVFLLNTMGYYVVFKCNQMILKREMSALIRAGSFHGSMVILKIPQPEKNRNFCRKSRSEFSWYGHLYDIVIEGRSGDSILFYCLRDRKEETLLADYNQFFSRTGRTRSSQDGMPLRALIHNMLFQALVTQAPELFFNPEKICKYPPVIPGSSTVYIKSPGHPPKFS